MAHCKLHTEKKESRAAPEQSRNAWVCISKFTSMSLLWGEKKEKQIINLPAANAHLVHNKAELAPAHTDGRAGGWE